MGRFYNLKNDNNRRFAAGIMALMLLFVVLFSVFFLAAEVGHECDHHDCPICDSMQQCANTVHTISSSTIVVLAAIVPIIFFISIINSYVSHFKEETLVSIKVRLDD